MEQSTFWEHLAEEIGPIMQIGESLINVTWPLFEKYHVDLNSSTSWERLPVELQNEIRSCIVAMTNEMPNITIVGMLLRAGTLYQSIFETLEFQYARLDKKDASTRTFILHLMEEIMYNSISSGTMDISDWRELLEKRKESLYVQNAGEYVYKKLYHTFCKEKKVSIYDFFYNRTSPKEIDKLLAETKNNLLLALLHREQTKKRGQGMSRFIIDCIHQWQEAELMKPLKSVFPFCQCLQGYWNNEINLGTRQGLEATYKQRY